MAFIEKSGQPGYLKSLTDKEHKRSFISRSAADLAARISYPAATSEDF